MARFRLELPAQPSLHIAWLSRGAAVQRSTHVPGHSSLANDGSVPGSPPTIEIGCSMTGGCSGGPWVIGLGSTNYVNGHNSYRPNNQPLEIYSPYFGDNAHSLMQLVVK